MKEVKQEFLTEVELDTGKVVRLRRMTMEDWDMVTQAAAQRAGDNQMLFGMATQQELLKRLIVEIDGKAPTSVERESIKKTLDASEYLALMEVVQQLVGKSKILRQEQVKSSGVK